MDTLPEELVIYIISYLDLRCQLRLSAVSVWWRAAVTDSLRRRQRLSLKDLEHRFWTNDVLSMLLPRLPALRALSGQMHYGHGKLDVDIVSENCPLLEKLDLSLFRLEPNCLERLCRRCPRLWDVRLPHQCSSDLVVLLLRRLPGVRALVLSGTDVSVAAVALLPTGLERLQLSDCWLPELSRQPADRWPRLTELDLLWPRCHGSSDGLAAALVAGCPRLQRLVPACDYADDRLLRLLPALPLQHLDLSHCFEMTEEDLVSCLGRLRQLRTLQLRDVPSVTDRVLNILAGVESLVELSLGAEYRPTQFTTGAVQRLVVFSSSLRKLELRMRNEELMKYFIAGLVSHLDPDRDITLAIPKFMLKKLAESGLPSESSPLRVVKIDAP